ncbi:MAG TPA: holo-[acyl-carrier-protein] synthase [Deltaproteobacteria bacterium]|nr:MAG: holo-[acyl-carrier-protein] synthase [Deltaproteobacteria bacterium GWA2_55_82]OGQ62013.1 MAG: holo-[acyl-carrier-protein] synthase [Deltaproteobacteria bacterium RIFCSPLOWO2_02_FULL_55_12]OIJ74130.1 MAG: holo-[acyl-carrier-protein] synthase [Deltaproteobacteria bacterium GWC2_55_46]HBG46746.1 holo-[acyl-carrier-protein] synthase [Deltaproteobacteria bacterium]HCY11245.1 holo-[acyl-carrier-protein] synthase [Deltaproteobacteria bacterium]
MGLHTGIDVVSISRIRDAAARVRFLERVFTPDELRYSFGRRDPYRHLAGRFAAKEACMKALRGLSPGLGWKDIEVKRDKDGRPGLVLRPEAERLLGKTSALVSISYSGDMAFALVSVG